MSETVGVVALEKSTGAELWRSPSVGALAYVTPRLVTLCGVDQVVVISSTRLSKSKPPRKRKPASKTSEGDKKQDAAPAVSPDMAKWLRQVSNHIVGISVMDGKELWRYSDWKCNEPYAQSIAGRQ